MIPENAMALVDLVANEIYQDRVSYLNVIIISSDGAGAVEARYYNQVTGLFEDYIAYDYHLLSYDPIVLP